MLLMLAESHHKVVRFDISVHKMLIMNIFYALEHLVCQHENRFH